MKKTISVFLLIMVIAGFFIFAYFSKSKEEAPKNYLSSIKARNIVETEGDWFYLDNKIDDYDLSNPVESFIAYLETDDTDKEIGSILPSIPYYEDQFKKIWHDIPNFERLRTIAEKENISQEESELFLIAIKNLHKHDRVSFAYSRKYLENKGIRMKYRITNIESKSIEDLNEIDLRIAKKYHLPIQEYQLIEFQWYPEIKEGHNKASVDIIKIGGSWYLSRFHISL
jgi:hypothetical protein